MSVFVGEPRLVETAEQYFLSGIDNQNLFTYQDIVKLKDRLSGLRQDYFSELAHMLTMMGMIRIFRIPDVTAEEMSGEEPLPVSPGVESITEFTKMRTEKQDLVQLAQSQTDIQSGLSQWAEVLSKYDELDRRQKQRDLQKSRIGQNYAWLDDRRLSDTEPTTLLGAVLEVWALRPQSISPFEWDLENQSVLAPPTMGSVGGEEINQRLKEGWRQVLQRRSFLMNVRRLDQYLKLIVQGGAKEKYLQSVLMTWEPSQ